MTGQSKSQNMFRNNLNYSTFCKCSLFKAQLEYERSFFVFNLNVTSSTQHQTPFVPKSALISKRKNGELENDYDFVNDLGNEFPIE